MSGQHCRLFQAESVLAGVRRHQRTPDLEEQWVLCVEEDVLQASVLITWEESTLQLVLEQQNMFTSCLGCCPLCKQTQAQIMAAIRVEE